MKAEEQILELLAEVLRKQDQMQGQISGLDNRMGSLDNRVSSLDNRVSSLDNRVELLGEEARLTNERLNVVIQTQQVHQQVLRTVATEQQRQRQEIEGIRDSTDAIARMQRDTNRRLDRLENPSDFV